MNILLSSRFFESNLFMKCCFLSLSCDIDNWKLKINDEEPKYIDRYRHHFINFNKAKIFGKSFIKFAGIVQKGGAKMFINLLISSHILDVIPSSFFHIGYELKYECPDGMVFDQDWYSPFLLLKCQVCSKSDGLICIKNSAFRILEILIHQIGKTTIVSPV